MAGAPYEGSSSKAHDRHSTLLRASTAVRTVPIIHPSDIRISAHARSGQSSSLPSSTVASVTSQNASVSLSKSRFSVQYDARPTQGAVPYYPRSSPQVGVGHVFHRYPHQMLPAPSLPLPSSYATLTMSHGGFQGRSPAPLTDTTTRLDPSAVPALAHMPHYRSPGESYNGLGYPKRNHDEKATPVLPQPSVSAAAGVYIGTSSSAGLQSVAGGRAGVVLMGAAGPITLLPDSEILERTGRCVWRFSVALVPSVHRASVVRSGGGV